VCLCGRNSEQPQHVFGYLVSGRGIVAFGLVLHELAQTQQRTGGHSKCQPRIGYLEPPGVDGRNDVAPRAGCEAAVRRDEDESMGQDDLALPWAPAKQTAGKPEAASEGFRRIVYRGCESVE
jgi:hypothetical protein